MATDWVAYIPWVYIVLQVVVFLIVSILGANHVRTQFLLAGGATQRSQSQELQIKTTEQDNDDFEQDRTEDASDPNSQSSDYGSFCKSWLKITWKMRNVYGAFGVHVFDVLTDVLVLIEWWNLGNSEVDHINPRTMAICGIAVLLFHKVMSTIAFWAKEKHITRCILQFFDLLIFEEIYISQRKIVMQFKNNSTESIDTTTSFKFIRNLEAIFESIPQSILQLVFIMRTSAQYENQSQTIRIVSILSIIQSMVSMTNSILKNDNVLMNLPKWKKHKQRFPPTIPFMKHALWRLSEVIYRIGLFALVWTVCEGQVFAVLLGFEVSTFLLFNAMMDRQIRIDNETWRFWRELTMDDICVRLQTIIVFPSELVYAANGSISYTFGAGDDCQCTREHICCHKICMGLVLGLVCCCYTPAVWLSTRCCCRRWDHYIHISLRIGMSMMQWIFLVCWALYYQDRFMFLFSFDHGLAMFIVSIMCYLIYTQYLFLFPNFSLPFGVRARDRFGYAFNGELEELQRQPLPAFPWTFVYHTRTGHGYGESAVKKHEAQITNETEFWDVCCNGHEGATCAMFALAKNHTHVVEWLENEKGANKHKQIFDNQTKFDQMDHEFARWYIDRENKYF